MKRAIQVARTFTLYPGDIATLRILAGARERSQSAVVRHLIRQAGKPRPRALSTQELEEIRLEDDAAKYARRGR